MKSILVTGGLGFIGSNFIKYIFNKYNYNIVNVDSITYAANLNNIPDAINSSSRYFFAKNQKIQTTWLLLRIVFEIKLIRISCKKKRCKIVNLEACMNAYFQKKIFK